MRLGSFQLKTPRERSSASLRRVTRADQRLVRLRAVLGFVMAAQWGELAGAPETSMSGKHFWFRPIGDLRLAPAGTGCASFGCRRVARLSGGTALNHLDLNGRHAVVTGGASGIGFAI